jgi:hypothetical protein
MVRPTVTSAPAREAAEALIGSGAGPGISIAARACP